MKREKKSGRPKNTQTTNELDACRGKGTRVHACLGLEHDPRCLHHLTFGVGGAL